MAVIILISKTVGDDEVKTYGGVECDVEGCTTAAKHRDGQPNLFEQGWFVAPGRHRCPKHFNDEAPAREPQRRYVDLHTKRL